MKEAWLGRGSIKRFKMYGDHVPSPHSECNHCVLQTWTNKNEVLSLYICHAWRFYGGACYLLILFPDELSWLYLIRQIY